MKWEYLIIGILDIRADNEIRFAKFGDKGWELIGVENDTAYFKRLKVPKGQEDRIEKLKNAVAYLMTQDYLMTIDYYRETK